MGSNYGPTTISARIDTREGLINALTEASELEHGLMLQYLFAAFSLKRFPREGVTERQVELIRGWQRDLFAVARQEMSHLATVTNLLSAFGGAPCLMRPNFPLVKNRWYGSLDFVLEKFGVGPLQRFVRFEQPAPTDVFLESIAPEDVVYDYMGELYRKIRSGIEGLDGELRGKGRELFIGPFVAQDRGNWTADMHVHSIRTLEDALSAIDFIVEEGEGASEDCEDSHFQTFTKMLAALREELEADPAFEPARPVARNPLTRGHRETKGPYTLIRDDGTKDCAELFNHVYCTMLLMLMQYFDFGGESKPQRRGLKAAARMAMSAIVRPLAEILTTLPIGPSSEQKAGPSFEIYGDLRLPGDLECRWIVLDERLETEVSEAYEILIALGDRVSRLAFVARNLQLLRDGLARLKKRGELRCSL